MTLGTILYRLLQAAVVLVAADSATVSYAHGYWWELAATPVVVAAVLVSLDLCRRLLSTPRSPEELARKAARAKPYAPELGDVRGAPIETTLDGEWLDGEWSAGNWLKEDIEQNFDDFTLGTVLGVGPYGGWRD